MPLLAESHTVELVLEGFVEALADPVGLGASRPGAGMIDVLDGQVQLVLMMLAAAAVFGTPIGQQAQHRYLLLLKPG